MRVRVLSILSALALAAIPAVPAAGFELFGIEVFGSQAEEDAEAVIGDPQPYTFSLEVVGGSPEVDAAVRNASVLAAESDGPASGAAGLLADAKGDYRRMLAALYNEGYYGGSISILVGGTEAVRLAPDTDLPDPVAVRAVVDPGPIFRFSSLAIANRAGPTADPEDQVDTPESLGFGVGEIAPSDVILRAETVALDAWRQQGYAKAEIAGREVVADHSSNTVDVTISVNPGRKAAFGDVGVQGTENMNPDFVRRQSGLTPGEEYDPDEVERARKRLARLEVFRSLRLEAAESIGSDGLLPYNIVVQEQPLRRFGVGATFSTIDGFGVEGFWLHRNLFGEAERLRLDARIAGIGFPVETEEFDYAFGGTFTKPGIWGPDTDFVASLAAERTVYDTYTETSASARAGLSHFLSDDIAWDLALTFERNRFDDDLGTRDFLTAGVFGSVTFDNRDSTTDPTEGFYANATLEPFYELNYGNLAVRATAEARTYFGFDPEGDFVLAGRIKGGVIGGADIAELPPDRLFFAGGGGSVRGYGYRSIGVDGPGETVTGGRYLLEGSVEARAKVSDTIGVVGFVDAGYVAGDELAPLEDVRLGAGLGLRYYTGLGPIRLDVAVPLNKRDNDPDYALYVGIGQAF